MVVMRGSGEVMSERVVLSVAILVELVVVMVVILVIKVVVWLWCWLCWQGGRHGKRRGHCLQNFFENCGNFWKIYLILIIASVSADASADESAAKYSEMSAILGVLGHIWPLFPSL